MVQMSTFATQTATFVLTWAIRSQMTDLSTTTALVCVTIGSCRPELLPQLLEGLDLPADFSRCRALIVLDHKCCTSHCGIDTSLSQCPACATEHTLTPRHQFPLAWADCTSPPSFANTDPHLLTTLSRFVEHTERPAIVSVSQASSPNETTLTWPHQLEPSQPLVLQTVRGCPLELKHV